MKQYVLSYWDDIKIIDESDDPYIKRNACNLIGFYTKFCHLIYQQFLNTGEWECSKSNIYQLMSGSHNTIDKYIKILERLGLIEVKRAKYDPKEHKRNSANIYKVTGMSNPYQRANKPASNSHPKASTEIKDEQPEQVSMAIDNHYNSPEADNKAIDKDDETTLYTGFDDKRASEITFKLFELGMRQGEWLRALESRSRRQVNLCRGKYMGLLPKDDRDYLDDYIDNLLIAA